jgi:hypothetical protein
VHWGGYYANALDIEADPQRRRLAAASPTLFLQRLVEYRALETKRVRVVAFQSLFQRVEIERERVPERRI